MTAAAKMLTPPTVKVAGNALAQRSWHGWMISETCGAYSSPNPLVGRRFH